MTCRDMPCYYAPSHPRGYGMIQSNSAQPGPWFTLTHVESCFMTRVTFLFYPCECDYMYSMYIICISIIVDLVGGVLGQHSTWFKNALSALSV